MPALILVAYASLLTFGLVDNVRGPFYLEILQSLKLDATRGSAFFAVTSMTAVAGSLLSHWLLKRISAVDLMLAAGVLLGLGFATISQAPSLPWLVVACAAFGFSFGCLNVSQNVVVFEAASEHRRRQFFSGLHAMYGIAALAAPLVAVSLRELGLTWRQGFLMLAALPLLVSVAGLKFRRLGRLAKSDQHVSGLERAGFLRAVAYSAILGAYLWGELSISTRLVLWLRTDRGLDATSADYMLAGFFLALLSGRLLFSALHFRGVENWLILMASTAFGAVLYGAGLAGSPWFVVLAGFALSPFYPVLMTQISLSFGERSAQAMGIVMGLGNLSLVLMHVAIGWLTDQWGLTRALYCGVGALILVTLLMLPLNVMGRRSK